uniref:Vitellogenin receptor n=1 Tax=Timema tahoe TaxID=61484 RepID=A0A7R9IGE0_9NEOP|nr:unnamed protein product [Timema tahoe]
MTEKPACSSQMFMCPDGICIGKRFVCDGHQDCKNGEDESQGKCGRALILVKPSYAVVMADVYQKIGVVNNTMVISKMPTAQLL